MKWYTGHWSFGNEEQKNKVSQHNPVIPATWLWLQDYKYKASLGNLPRFFLKTSKWVCYASL